MLQVVTAGQALPVPEQLVQARNRRFVVTAVEAGSAIDATATQHLRWFPGTHFRSKRRRTGISRPGAPRPPVSRASASHSASGRRR